jgi:hypothetical protein
MLTLGALVLLAQAETGSIRQGVGGGGDSPRRPCLPVQVSSPQREGQRGTFSATEILDLRLSTQLRRQLQGSHVLQIKVFTPRGYAYQILTVPFTGTSGQLQELSATLPVAGTAIMSNSLYGRWTVEPFLDGASCGVTRSFLLRQ